MRRQTYGYPPIRWVVSSAHARDYFQRKETAVRLNAGHGVRGQVPRSNDKRINPIRPASEPASEWMDVFTIPQIRPSSSVTIDLQTAGGARNADSHPHVTVMIRHATHTHPFNGPFSGTTRVSRYQKGKTNLDFTEARDSEWQRHQLRHIQVCTSLQADNHASTPPLSFLQAGCPSCRPTNSVKALKARNRPTSTIRHDRL